MRRSLAALTLATLLGSTIASTAGCARETTDAAPPGGAVSYVPAGRLLPDDAMDVLRIPDEQARLDAFMRRSSRVERCFLVPAGTFQWLFKQAARARRIEEAPPDE